MIKKLRAAASVHPFRSSIDLRSRTAELMQNGICNVHGNTRRTKTEFAFDFFAFSSIVDAIFGENIHVRHQFRFGSWFAFNHLQPKIRFVCVRCECASSELFAVHRTHAKVVIAAAVCKFCRGVILKLCNAKVFRNESAAMEANCVAQMCCRLLLYTYMRVHCIHRIRSKRRGRNWFDVQFSCLKSISADDVATDHFVHIM